jgi:ATP-dependent DNA ligase
MQDGQIFDEVTKGNTIIRAKFYNIRPDRFSCRLDTSNDAGKSWIKPIDIEAVRAA